MCAEDRGLLLALAHIEADECTGCGNSLSISTDPKTQRRWTVNTRVCESCRVLEATVENAHAPGATKVRGEKYSVSLTGGGESDG